MRAARETPLGGMASAHVRLEKVLPQGQLPYVAESGGSSARRCSNSLDLGGKAVLLLPGQEVCLDVLQVEGREAGGVAGVEFEEEDGAGDYVRATVSASRRLSERGLASRSAEALKAQLITTSEPS